MQGPLQSKPNKLEHVTEPYRIGKSSHNIAMCGMLRWWRSWEQHGGHQHKYCVYTVNPVATEFFVV